MGGDFYRNLGIGLDAGGSKVLSRKCTWTLLSEFCAACAEQGMPDAVRTDNEAMFTSRLWASFFKIAGIKRQRIDLGSPWQNGRIERLFGTLKPLLSALKQQLKSKTLQPTCLYALYERFIYVGGVTPSLWNLEDRRQCSD